MTLVRTPLLEDRTPESMMLMGVEWDDVTLQVNRFAFRMDIGNRAARFTLTRISDNAIVSHDFVPGETYVPGTTIWWDPPFAMAMRMRLNTMSGQNVGIPDGWRAELVAL